MTEHHFVEPQKFVTAKAAADRVGYSTDYVGRLAREQKVAAKKVGRQWLVDVDSLKLFTLEMEAEKRRKHEALKESRRVEQVVARYPRIDDRFLRQQPALRRTAILETTAVTACVCLLLLLGSVIRTNQISSSSLLSGMSEVEGHMQTAFTLGPVADFFDTWWWFVREEEHMVIDYVETESESRTAAVTTDGEVGQVLRPPQVETNTGTVLIAESKEVALEPEKLVAASFSDNTLVEFTESDAGFVTPVFRAGAGEPYPFRVVSEPVTSSE